MPAPSFSLPWHGTATRTHASALPTIYHNYDSPPHLPVNTLSSRALCEDVEEDTGSKVQGCVASVRGLPPWGASQLPPNSIQTLYQLNPSIYAHTHNLLGQPGCVSPGLWAALWLANGTSLLRDSVIQVDDPMAYPATQNGWDTGLVWGDAIPELPLPRGSPQVHYSAQEVCLRTCPPTHIVRVLRITFHTAEQAWQGE